MNKILVFFTAFLLFAGCSDNKSKASSLNDEIPIDVNISQSETNVTVDENFPPEPVLESR